jgi:hypothetical protein
VHDTGSGPDGAIEALAGLIYALGDLDQDVNDAVRIDRIRLLEELKSAVAAAQVRETAAFVTSQRAEQQAARVPAERVGRGIAAQVALAMRISPWAAQRYVGWAMILPAELPHTYAALQAGRVSEHRAMTIARETIWLSREHRALVDAELSPRLETLGDRGVERETRKLAYRLDPHGYVGRVRGAESDRRVSLRPAPDAMARLTALLPAAQGVAVYAALASAADTATAAADGRGRGQLMADTLVQRVTGQAAADQVPVEVDVIIDADTLLGRSDEPAQLAGYGPLPADTARELIAQPDRVWLRRLFRRPSSGELITMETRRRCFTGGQRRFIQLRDQTCRTPWCDAPIRHIDHVQPAGAGGPTSVDNGQGLCVACNHAKQAPGWQSTRAPNREVETETPTGHRYRSAVA